MTPEEQSFNSLSNSSNLFLCTLVGFVDGRTNTSIEVEIPPLCRLIFGPFKRCTSTWNWIDNPSIDPHMYNFVSQTLYISPPTTNSFTGTFPASTHSPANASSLASNVIFAGNSIRKTANFATKINDAFAQAIMKDFNTDPVAYVKPKCDCGAATCNTTHATWCSTKK